jgi:exocyst complex component 2
VADAGVTFCGTPCEEFEWESDTKIKCVTPAGVGSGPVIVTTKSGGAGTCTVEFFFEHVVADTASKEVDMFTEVDIWTNEATAKEQAAADLQTSATEDDPLRLGLGTKGTRISSKAMRMLGQADPLENYAAQHPHSNATLTSSAFDPVYCLVAQYRECTFDQLCDGANNLSNILAEHGRESREMINKNSGAFLSSFETLSDVRDLISKYRAASLTGDPFSDFDKAVHTLLEKSNKTFDHMLRKSRQANKARNVLHVLRSYQFLFNLPKT